VVVSGPIELALSKEATRVADWCNGLIERYELPVTLLGPAPCPLARIKDRWRWHVLLKGPSDEIGKVVRYSAGRITRSGDLRVIIDRDPVSLL
jgi:primosomal protein N' (replication factor Y)